MPIGSDTTVDKSSPSPAVSSSSGSETSPRLASDAAPPVRMQLVLSPLQKLTVAASLLLLLTIAVTNLHAEGWFLYPAPVEMFLKRAPSAMPGNFRGPGGPPGQDQSGGASSSSSGSTPQAGPPGMGGQQMPGGPPGYNQMPGGPPGMGYPPGMGGQQQMPPGMQQVPGQQGGMNGWPPNNGQMPPNMYGGPPGSGIPPQQPVQSGSS